MSLKSITQNFQICAQRFPSSIGYKYRGGRAFGDQLRPEKVEKRCAHWNEDVLGRTYKLDETKIGTELVVSENLTW